MYCLNHSLDDLRKKNHPFQNVIYNNEPYSTIDNVIFIFVSLLLTNTIININAF